MITFTIEASNFIAAGAIEKVLKDEKIRFTTTIKNQNSTTKKRGYSRMTPELVKDILGYLATHADETNTSVANHFDVGQNTIWRIRNGTHAMCKKV